MLQAEERASAKVEYRSEKFNIIIIKESRIRLGRRKINRDVNFGGSLNILQVKKHDPAVHAVSASTALMK